ncbi:MAG: hypothetical protein KAR42_06645 [candidate division Zixibacteria bacterium]|nr:hypothetical protein [candidate division Zixibacteria bacterium]
MKKIMITMTVAMMAFMMVFAGQAEASKKFKKKRQIQTVKRVKTIGYKHKIVFYEYISHRGEHVRHGVFKEKIKGRVVKKGTYRHGRKDGEWTHWTKTGKRRITKIVTFDNGARVDVYKPIYRPTKMKKTVKICRKPHYTHASVRVHSPHFSIVFGF